MRQVWSGKVAMMSKKDVRLYLAHVSQAPRYPSEDKGMRKTGADSEASGPSPDEVASYIADLLEELEKVAADAGLISLSDLIRVAGEEARLYCQPGFGNRLF